eukprot:CAMPEP_0205896662 /NCGR_PEP_ID=MMETSP1083-20121108/25076_1 /ASSEMBLY_ACC=CAM_ASM_000430 /TAXON_ID=97485 /ORGANISM="Prymnesium parvum, Strain Texoma1" /LENGTH=80 /DNA_ID=CAMNT_0053261755 /DNA_START=331 /DNA_END=573 /DNA_ORIENTATION=+
MFSASTPRAVDAICGQCMASGHARGSDRGTPRRAAVATAARGRGVQAAAPRLPLARRPTARRAPPRGTWAWAREWRRAAA